MSERDAFDQIIALEYWPNLILAAPPVGLGLSGNCQGHQGDAREEGGMTYHGEVFDSAGRLIGVVELKTPNIVRITLWPGACSFVLNSAQAEELARHLQAAVAA